MKALIALLPLVPLAVACAAVSTLPAASIANLGGHDWKLVEINGQPVSASDRPAHIEFSVADHRVSGSSGCNSFGGTFSLAPGNGIHFHELIHTMMACQGGMETEGAFMAALDQAESYTVAGDILILNSGADAAIARFKAD